MSTDDSAIERAQQRLRDESLRVHEVVAVQREKARVAALQAEQVAAANSHVVARYLPKFLELKVSGVGVVAGRKLRNDPWRTAKPGVSWRGGQYKAGKKVRFWHIGWAKGEVHYSRRDSGDTDPVFGLFPVALLESGVLEVGSSASFQSAVPWRQPIVFSPTPVPCPLGEFHVDVDAPACRLEDALIESIARYREGQAT